MLDSANNLRRNPTGAGKCPGQPLAGALAPDPAGTLRNATALWAEANTRPETLDRKDKLRDKVSAVTSFFGSCSKHPGEVTPGDGARWRAEMESRGLKPATVYARVSRVSAFYRWLMSEPAALRIHPEQSGLAGAPTLPTPVSE